MASTTKRSTTKRVVPPIAAWFQQWLTMRDESGKLEDRVGTLRDRMLDVIVEHGQEDDRGNVWFDLPGPVRFEDRNGKVYQYTTLKREKHLIPATPLPDPDATVELLRKKRLWLTVEQEKLLADLMVNCRFAVIEVAVDTEAVSRLYYEGKITEEEYDELLEDQREQFQFRPSES